MEHLKPVTQLRFARIAVVAFLFACAHVASPKAATCGEDALGTERVINLDEIDGGKFGSIQYASLPLEDREVVLTFDDGPRAETTREVLAALREQCVRATFFLLGNRIEREPTMVAEILAQGHSVGTHTYSHPDLTHLDGAAAMAEVGKGWDPLVANLPPDMDSSKVRMFRAPNFGSTDELDEALREQGFFLISADVTAQDFDDPSALSVVNRLLDKLARVRRGIVLMHDIKPVTARMLPLFLSELKLRGFKVVQIDIAGEQPG
ncbi:polysaccharide deacetylase family protein [Kaistia dalseonensis]|uniref:Chitooligosaccharide deacetylase n=1 Tax=Kaistia dalseonensis TaxID=410840 RepID=A0ABU0H226_9HYPH|nr:polysaccharide deacetylase family protein [Kaistia dalseonensis]MCX5493773.1 polysaccharide deacetylase family protein [Kaistia dalseonensis]MDQ0436337.1 peptidoglycan/xylan/chitin deacetylase (PgdA/CDA1 family) [Kaistia dalseonensis]